MAYKLKDNSKAKDPNPIYYKLQLELKDKIESRNWIPGDIIPPESKIAKEHNVSLGTIRKAILNLVSDGYLYRIQGKGTICLPCEVECPEEALWVEVPYLLR